MIHRFQSLTSPSLPKQPQNPLWHYDDDDNKDDDDDDDGHRVMVMKLIFRIFSIYPFIAKLNQKVFNLNTGIYED